MAECVRESIAYGCPPWKCVHAKPNTKPQIRKIEAAASPLKSHWRDRFTPGMIPALEFRNTASAAQSLGVVCLRSRRVGVLSHRFARTVGEYTHPTEMAFVVMLLGDTAVRYMNRVRKFRVYRHTNANIVYTR